MIRLFILIILAAIAFAVAYFQLKSIPMAKKMAVIGGGFAAAIAGAALQMIMPFYMALLAIVGVTLLAALLYMKRLEKEQLEKQRIAEDRREKRLLQVSTGLDESELESEPDLSPIDQADTAKPYTMESINPDRKEL